MVKCARQRETCGCDEVFCLQSSTAISGQLSAGNAILTFTMSKTSLTWTPKNKQNKTKQANEKRLPHCAISTVSIERMKNTLPHSMQKKKNAGPTMLSSLLTRFKLVARLRFHNNLKNPRQHSRMHQLTWRVNPATVNLPPHSR